MKQDEGIPLYAKVGWVVSWALMLLLLGLIFKNCAGSIRYGAGTPKEQVNYHYRLGYKDGQAGKLGNDKITNLVENPLLKKAYSKGFREGLGSRSRGESSRLTD